jgi:hypothetical protein
MVYKPIMLLHKTFQATCSFAGEARETRGRIYKQLKSPGTDSKELKIDSPSQCSLAGR